MARKYDSKDEADVMIDGADVELTPDPKQQPPAKKTTAIFATAEEFSKLADEYFDYCDEEDRLYGEAGLALYLSQHNRKGKAVTLDRLRGWYNGDHAEYLQEAVRMAYLRIQDQVDHDPRYQDKAMSARGMFLQKQKWFGGYADKPKDEAKELKVNLVMGGDVTEGLLKG